MSLLEAHMYFDVIAKIRQQVSFLFKFLNNTAKHPNMLRNLKHQEKEQTKLQKTHVLQNDHIKNIKKSRNRFTLKYYKLNYNFILNSIYAFQIYLPENFIEFANLTEIIKRCFHVSEKGS